MEVLGGNSFLETDQGFGVTFGQFVITNPLEHQLVRKYPIVIDFQTIFIK